MLLFARAIVLCIEVDMGKSVRLFINAKSGTAESSPERITTLFAEHDCACSVTKLEPGIDLATLAARESMEVDFIAAGGDGTVNAVANVVAGTQRRLGVLALGTLNHFAKDAGLPITLEEAVKVAAGSTVREMDAATVNGQIFMNNSSLGFYPGMVIDRERMKKSGWNKWTSLVIASAKAFARFRCLEVELEAGGEVKRCRTPFLFVGNNEYEMEGMQLGKRACLDEGVLSLYLAPGITRAGMLRLGLYALLGRIGRETNYAEFKVKKFRVNVRRKKMHVSLDGELRRLANPLEYAIRPRALRVLCPEGDAE